MEEILSNYSVSDILIFGFIIGMVFNMIQDIIMSLIDYLREKAWRVNDYEKVIYEHVGSWDGDDAEEKEIINNAHVEYEKRLQKRKNLDKFLNKFRRNKKSCKKLLMVQISAIWLSLVREC